MQTTIITIETGKISDWESFHSLFKTTLGFPDFYGHNMNAWVDCMTSVDDPESGMTNPSIRPGELLALRIDDAPDFQKRCPELYNALVEGAAFVNYRRVTGGGTPVLTLMLCGWFDEPV